MQIEVPSDKYDDAIRAMEEKSVVDKQKGVSNPEEAKNIIRKGHFTYEQARNIAKAGTIESLTYDAVNGTIVASTAFGVTAMITLATSVWNGDDFDDALKLATYQDSKLAVRHCNLNFSQPIIKGWVKQCSGWKFRSYSCHNGA